MAQLRIHQNLQAINRILAEVKDIANQPFVGWHNANLRLQLGHLKDYSRRARDEEFGNTIPEVAQHIEKLEDLIERVEGDAQGIHFRNAFRAHLGSLENLDVHFKEIAKNVLNTGARRRRTRGRRRRTHGRRHRTHGRRHRTHGRKRKTRGRRRRTHRRK